MGTGVSHNRKTTRKCRVAIKKHEGFEGRTAKHLVSAGLLFEDRLRRMPRNEGTQFPSGASFLNHSIVKQSLLIALRKEVIQPHLPIRLPCYDFTPVISPAFGRSFLAVRSRTSGVTDSHGVTGGVYKTRERIHRDILIRDY